MHLYGILNCEKKIKKYWLTYMAYGKNTFTLVAYDKVIDKVLSTYHNELFIITDKFSP